MDLKQTFGAVVISGAGLATATSMFADEPDLIADLINANSAFQNAAADIVHEPIISPLENDGLYIDFNNDVADIINAAMPDTTYTDGMDLTNGKFLTFTNMPQSEITYEAAADYRNHFLQYGAGVYQEADHVSANLIPQLIQRNEWRAQNFLYVSDQEQYRTLDKWTEGEIVDDVNPLRRDLRSGDCDEYTLWSEMDDNQQFGISGSAQTFVILDPKDPSIDSLHAMRLVRTTEGDMMFDMDGSARFVDEVAKDYDFMYAMSFTDKSFWQRVEVTPAGVKATIDETPEYAEGVPLPMPRRDRGPGL